MRKSIPGLDFFSASTLASLAGVFNYPLPPKGGSGVLLSFGVIHTDQSITIQGWNNIPNPYEI
ncbi:hypothetical protein GCM10007049_27210 [Echinicola pacifica]|uniref:Uncharacterized protein n=1 Tax=Echinicola pacifica TaxID=346377 RepID=A0A918Q397_9BACT|nr:hypothetical protein GCM10007049_27210 [Echinicola pacifica]